MSQEITTTEVTEVEVKKDKATQADASEETETTEKKKGKGKIILVLVLTLLLAGGAFFGFNFYMRGVNYISTDNARVTTNIITVISPSVGRLESYTAVEGQRVERDEIIGWVEHAGPLRAPIDGLVVRSYAVENQMVSPMEPLAVIADVGRIHIEANIEETDILRIQRGQAATITVDALGRQQFAGYVAEIGRVTTAELTGSALFFNTGGTFTRVTHLIPVEINIVDDVDLSYLIGVNARVQISVS